MNLPKSSETVAAKITLGVLYSAPIGTTLALPVLDKIILLEEYSLNILLSINGVH